MKKTKAILLICLLGALTSCDFFQGLFNSEPKVLAPFSESVVGFWDFDIDGSNAIAGGASWRSHNIVFKNSHLVADGVYLYSQASDLEFAEVDIVPFDLSKFTVSASVAVEFVSGNRTPILVGGSSFRWLKIRVSVNDRLELVFNNHVYNFESDLTITAGQTHQVTVAVNATTGEVAVYVDDSGPGVYELPFYFEWNYPSTSLPDIVDEKITIQDYSNATAFKGSMDWVIWVNDILSPEDIAPLVEQYR